MSFIEAIKSGFVNYANFEDRATRSEYWWWHLFLICVAIVIGIFAIHEILNQSEGIFTGVYVVFALATAMPTYAVTIRRLHDTDRSGRHYLVTFLPVVGAIILLLWLMQKGTDGPNQYGS